MNRLLNAVLIILALVMQGCIGYYSDLTHLSDDEMAWVDCYNVGDTVLFESNLNVTDTLVVDCKNVENSRNRFYIHFIDDAKDKYIAKAIYGFYIKHGTDSIWGRFLMEKSTHDEIEWYPNLLWRVIKSQINNGNPVKISNFTSHGKTYENCLVINDDNSEYLEEDAVIDSFVISKDYGLLYYKFSTGEEFFRKFE